MSALDPERGIKEVQYALESTNHPERFVERLGWHGFLWIIRERLDTIYPAPIFRAQQYGVNWGSDHGGADIDPGIKWATLLDMALAELEPKDG